MIFFDSVVDGEYMYFEFFTMCEDVSHEREMFEQLSAQQVGWA